MIYPVYCEVCGDACHGIPSDNGSGKILRRCMKHRPTEEEKTAESGNMHKGPSDSSAAPHREKKKG